MTKTINGIKIADDELGEFLKPGMLVVNSMEGLVLILTEPKLYNLRAVQAIRREKALLTKKKSKKKSKREKSFGNRRASKPSPNKKPKRSIKPNRYFYYVKVLDSLGKIDRLAWKQWPL